MVGHKLGALRVQFCLTFALTYFCDRRVRGHPEKIYLQAEQEQVIVAIASLNTMISLTYILGYLEGSRQNFRR